MLTPNADLMRQAREALKGKWGLAVVGNLIFLAVTAVAQLLPLVGWVANLIVGGPLILGLSLFFLGLSRGQDVPFSRLFDEFNVRQRLITYSDGADFSLVPAGFSESWPPVYALTFSDSR
jgi:uncharacterized membrane protein